MPTAGNAALLYANLADDGTVTASSWAAAAPPSTLQDPHVSRRWKGRAGDTESITFDLGSAQSFDTVCLLGCQAVDADDNQDNMTAAAIRQIRLSASDPTAIAADAYDSGSVSGEISSKYGSMIELLTSPVSARYGRIDLSQAGAQALLAGRLVIGIRSQFTVNFDYGGGFGFGDNSRTKKAAGGQTFVDQELGYRIINLTFSTLDPDDRYDFVQEADRLNGLKDDVLFIVDTESSDIARDTVWGLVTNLSLPTQPSFAFFSKVYSIEERL